jgi:phospholipid/cholesterol/gamma-HCH transport system substrate-binding protein
MESMTRDTREIIIGAVSLSVLAIIFMLINRGDDQARTATDDYYRIIAFFGLGDGFMPGDEVQLGGIQIGFVEPQSIDEAYHAVLTFAVHKDIPLPLDTAATIHTNGLFGSKFVVLEPGGKIGYLGEGDEISYT